MVVNNRIRDVVHTSTTRMLKLFIILSIFLCLNSNVFAVTGNNYNQSLNNRYLGYETTKNILNKLEYTQKTDDEVKAITNQFNLWFENYSDETVTLRNIIFFKFNETYLNWFVSNGSFSNTLKYAYLGEIPYNTFGNISYAYFENWVTDSNGAITGAATTPLTERFWASTSSYGNSNSSHIPTNAEYTEATINLKGAVAPVGTFAIYAKTSYYGYKSYFLSNTYELAINPDAIVTPTPTPTPTQTPTSGDYGPAIDNINNNLNNIQSTIKSGDEEVKNEINDIKNFLSGEADFENKEISSGEILDSINIETIRNPYENFWFELTEILNDAFTKEVRSLDLKVRNKEFQINIDQIGWNPNETMKTFLNLASTTAVCIAIIKWITVITEKIQSGSMDEVLEANEEGICSLF